MATGEQFFYINNRIIDSRGLAVASSLYFYLTSTTTLEPIYADYGLTTPLANPVIVNAGAAIPNIYIDPSITYRVRIVAATGEVINDYDPFDPISAADLTFIQAGDGAVPRSIQSKLQETVSVTDYGAVGDFDRDAGTGTDNTLAFAKATQHAQDTGCILEAPPGNYKVTAKTPITKPFIFRGSGTDTTEITMVSDTVQPVFEVAVPSASSIIGLQISGMHLVCNGTGATEICDGITMTTESDSIITQSILRDLQISNCRDGITFNGVFYGNVFANIKISPYFGGSITRYGIYSDAGNIDVRYNTFDGIEVTGVAAGHYAFYIQSNDSIFANLRADACLYISSPGGIVSKITIESISSGVAANASAMYFNQIQVLSGASLINVPQSVCSSGIRLIGSNTIVGGARFTAPYPNAAYFLEPGSGGVINGTYRTAIPVTGSISGTTLTITAVPSDGPKYVAIGQTVGGASSGTVITALGTGTGGTGTYTVNNSQTLASGPLTLSGAKIEVTTSSAIMNNWVFSSCQDITDLSLVYAEGTWTPNFAVSGEAWATPPTVSSATWVRTGRQIELTLSASNGVCADYSSIGWSTGDVPAAGSVGTATMSSGDVSKRFVGSIAAPGSVKINNIPAQTLTGVFWQMTATYRI